MDCKSTLAALRENDEAWRSFSGARRVVTLAPRTPLYKFVWISKDYHKPPGAYWISESSFKTLLDWHVATDIPMIELGRAFCALAFDFKAIVSGVVKVRLRRSACAVVGTVAPQILLDRGRGKSPGLNRLSDNLKKLKGGGGIEQVWLPNLEWGDVSDVIETRLYWKGSSHFLFDRAEPSGRSE